MACLMGCEDASHTTTRDEVGRRNRRGGAGRDGGRGHVVTSEERCCVLVEIVVLHYCSSAFAHAPRRGSGCPTFRPQAARNS